MDIREKKDEITRIHKFRLMALLIIVAIILCTLYTAHKADSLVLSVFALAYVVTLMAYLLIFLCINKHQPSNQYVSLLFFSIFLMLTAIIFEKDSLLKAATLVEIFFIYCGIDYYNLTWPRERSILLLPDQTGFLYRGGNVFAINFLLEGGEIKINLNYFENGTLNETNELKYEDTGRLTIRTGCPRPIIFFSKKNNKIMFRLK